jgi:hypothetical protein
VILFATSCTFDDDAVPSQVPISATAEVPDEVPDEVAIDESELVAAGIPLPVRVDDAPARVTFEVPVGARRYAPGAWEAEHAARTRAAADRHTTANWFGAVKGATRTLLIATFVSNDGVATDGTTLTSTWAVDQHLAGPDVGETFTLLQEPLRGELPRRGALEARRDQSYAVVLEDLGAGDYELAIDPDRNVGAFLVSSGENRFSASDGPTFTLTELLTEAGDWQ